MCCSEALDAWVLLEKKQSYATGPAFPVLILTDSAGALVKQRVQGGVAIGFPSGVGREATGE